MYLPYNPNFRDESGYECICIVINGKKHSVPLNILSSVFISFKDRIVHVEHPHPIKLHTDFNENINLTPRLCNFLHAQLN